TRGQEEAHGHAVHDRAHAVLADAVVDLPAAEAADVDGRGVLELHAGVLGEVGAAGDHAGQHVEHRVHDGGARLPGGELVTLLPRGQLGLPAWEAALLVARVELRGHRRLRLAERRPATLPRLARAVTTRA